MQRKDDFERTRAAPFYHLVLIMKPNCFNVGLGALDSRQGYILVVSMARFLVF